MRFLYTGIIILQHCTGSSHFPHQKMFAKWHILNYLKMCENHDILAYFSDSRTLKYAGMLISAHYLLRTFSGALSVNSSYSVAKNSI